MTGEETARILKVVFAVLAALAAVGALAQPYPARAVRFIVPFAPGGASDIVGRAAGQKLSEIWAQPVVVDNRAGGSGQIGTEAVARAAPDGYTLLVVEPTFAIAPSLFSKLPYDTLQDFIPIVQIGQGPQVLVVHPSIPVKSVKDLLALARSRPGDLNFASPGTGTTGHLGMELFKLLGKVNMVHIPYKGAGPAVVDLVGGQVSIGLVSVSSALSYIKAGRLRGLAVTSAKRFAAVPELPTIAEAALPGFDTLQWWGLVAPRATPVAVVNKIAADVTRFAELPDVRERMLTLGAEPVSSTPERFGAFIRSEIEKWGKLVKASGARVE